MASAVTVAICGWVVPGLAATAAADPSCVTSSPGAYSVTVCITVPDGPLQGEVTISGTITTGPGAPAVTRAIFRLGSSTLLSDFGAPYRFELPTERWVDGPRTINLSARMSDGWESAPVAASVDFANGITQVPRNERQFEPRSGAADDGGPLVVAATGDGAGGLPDAGAVVDLVSGWEPDLFLYLGDVYNSGTATEFHNWYGHDGQLFHRFWDITNPTPGNHEYGTAGAAGYFDYWDNVPSYYSVDAGGWHIVSINSNPRFGELDATSAQYRWLAEDLARHDGSCTLVFAHHPRFSLTRDGGLAELQPLWELMTASGVDVFLTGHAHHYERWRPLDGSGAPSPSGTHQLVVGTGGLNLQPLHGSDPRVAHAFADSSGALKLELHPDRAHVRMVDVSGAVRDEADIGCGEHRDTHAPSTPTGLRAETDEAGAHLSWTPSTDDVGVTAYSVLRDGAPVADVASTTWTDATLAPGATVAYQVIASDAAGNRSPPSAAVEVTMPLLGSSIFADGFESGGLSAWSVASGLVVQSERVASGSWAASASTDGSAAVFASRWLAEPVPRLTYRMRVWVESQGSKGAYLLRFRTGTNANVAGVYRAASGRLAYRNVVTGKDTVSTVSLEPGRWYELVVTLDVGSGTIGVVLDGVVVSALSRNDDFGPAPIGRVELGDSMKGAPHRFAYDDIHLTGPSTAVPEDVSPPSAPTDLEATIEGSVVRLAWTAASDDVGVTGYRVLRDGTLAGTTQDTTWTDPSLAPGQGATYSVEAFDGAGNVSAPSAPVEVTVPPPSEAAVLFADGFESGGLSAWSVTSGLVVQSERVASGSWAASASTDGSAAVFASRWLAEPVPRLTYRMRVWVESQGSKGAYLLRFRTGTNANVAGVYRAASGRLAYRNVVTGKDTVSTVSLEPGRWYELVVTLDVGSGTIGVVLDGVVVSALSRNDDFGPAPIGRVELGDSMKGAPHRFAYDDIQLTDPSVSSVG